ncbi:MAG: hypothetical protein A3G35_02310 [candidate division NC10 bacterium RIFCSPLOWO2_12_FULL_66_18]|nr:MAG: hypothetical protein A3G35_02310 [candidate division NC10 bacterium RIFCSPLOWO2_12_FULL_66_18]
MDTTYVCEDLAMLPTAWGQVIRRPTAPATFHNEQLSYWDAVAAAAFPEETGIGWFELRRRPLRGTEVERHLRTPEALLCFEGDAICVLGDPVEPSALTPERVRAFRVRQGEGILFRPGTWHAVPFPLTERAVFWVVFRKRTAEEDLEVVDVARVAGFGFEVCAPTVA